MSKNSILLILVISTFWLNATAQEKENPSSKENSKIIEIEIGSPIVISLTNHHDGGEWEIQSKPEDLQLQEKRKGYISTYFVFKANKLTQGPVSFLYKNGNTADKKIYFINVKEKSAVTNPLNGKQNNYNNIKGSDSENSQSNKTNEMVIVTKKADNKSVTELPDTVKTFIDDLVQEELYEKALSEITKLEEGEKTSLDSIWYIKKKITILDKLNRSENIINYVNTQLEESKDNQKKMGSDLEFFLRINKAKALYKLSKKEDAHSELVYIKNYFSENPIIFYELGNFYFKEDMIKKGISIFEYMISKFEDHPAKDEVYLKLANYYYQVVGLNGYNLSYKYYDKIVKIGAISPYYKEALRMVEYLDKNFLNIR